MPKAAIVYFSGTGNTKFIAKNLKLELENNNINVDLINVEHDTIMPKQYDYILIGGPIYAERYTDLLLNYIDKNLKDYSGKCMLFATQVIDRSPAAFQHAINKFKFLNVSYCEYFTMPNNFYNFLLFKKTTEEEAKIAINESLKRCKRSIRYFIRGSEKRYYKNKPYIKMIDITYKAFYKYYMKHLWNKVTIDTDKCINCKLCEKSCPTKAISIENGVSVNNKCLLCQRCINNCPTEAFVYKDTPCTQYKPDFMKDKKK